MFRSWAIIASKKIINLFFICPFFLSFICRFFLFFILSFFFLPPFPFSLFPSFSPASFKLLPVCRPFCHGHPAIRSWSPSSLLAPPHAHSRQGRGFWGTMRWEFNSAAQTAPWLRANISLTLWHRGHPREEDWGDNAVRTRLWWQCTHLLAMCPCNTNNYQCPTPTPILRIPNPNPKPASHCK